VKEIIDVLIAITMIATVVLAGKWVIDKIFDWAIQVIEAPFKIRNIKKTRLHYYDHEDRYFDFETGQWQWKTSQENQ